MFVFFFFFQAEDGIRDYKVTGVQTCALPILYRETQVLPGLHLRTALLTCARPLAGMPPRSVRRFIRTVPCTVHFCAGLAGRRIAICAMTWLSSATTKIGRASCRERG